MDRTRRVVMFDIPRDWLKEIQNEYYEDGAKGDNKKSTSTANIRSDLIDEHPGGVTQARLDATREWASDRSDLDSGSYFDPETRYEMALRRIIESALSLYGLFDNDEYHKHPVVIRSIYQDGVWPDHGSMTYSDVEDVMNDAGFRCDPSSNHVGRCVATFDITNQEPQDDIPAEYDIDYFREHYIEKENPDTQRELTERIDDDTGSDLDITFDAVQNRIHLFGLNTDQSKTTNIKSPDKFRYRHWYELRPPSDSADQQLDNDDLTDIELTVYKQQGSNPDLRVINAMDDPGDKDITGASKDEIKSVFDAADGINRIEAVASEYNVPVPLAETALVFHGILSKYRYRKLTETPALAEGATIGGDLTNPEGSDPNYGESGVLAGYYIYLGCSVRETADILNTSEGIVRFAIKYYRHENRYKTLWKNPELDMGRPSDAVVDAPDDGGRLTNPSYLHDQLENKGLTPYQISTTHNYESGDVVRQLANMYQLDTPTVVAEFGKDNDTIEVDSNPERAVGILLTSLHSHPDLSDLPLEVEYIGRSRKDECIELDVSDIDDCDKETHEYTPDYRIDIAHLTVYIEAKGGKDNKNIGENDAEISDKQKAEAMMNALDDHEWYVTITDGVDLCHYDHDYRFDTDPVAVDETTDDVLAQGDNAFVAMIADVAPEFRELTTFTD